MKWMILAFVVAIAAVRLATPQTTANRTIPNINLDANAHTITANVTCLGDNVFKQDIFVDGVYNFSMTNWSPTPSGFKVAQQ